jgi:hypothetical protein
LDWYEFATVSAQKVLERGALTASDWLDVRHRLSMTDDREPFAVMLNSIKEL